MKWLVWRLAFLDRRPDLGAGVGNPWRTTMPLPLLDLAIQRLQESKRFLMQARQSASFYGYARGGHGSEQIKRQERMAIVSMKKAMQHTQAAVDKLGGRNISEDSGGFD